MKMRCKERKRGGGAGGGREGGRKYRIEEQQEQLGVVGY